MIKPSPPNKPLPNLLENSIPIESAFNVGIYPNPAQDLVNLRIEASGLSSDEFEIEIIDQKGRVLLRKSSKLFELNSNSELGLDISAIPEGIYFIRITNNEYNEVNKLIKSK